jgi:stage V sporulation protein AE
MIYFNSFIFAGLICLIGQIILDNTKLTPGHITSIFVVIGSFLDTFDIYDKIVLIFGGGALVPITSFGHQLIHGAMDTVNNFGVMGLFMGMFDLTSAGIVAAIIFSFVFGLIFKPRD